MGGDFYDGRDVIQTTSSSGYSDSAAKVIGLVKTLHSNLDPKKWKEENLQCDSLNPIVFALDVTGSMGDWSKIIYDKLPMFYGQLLMQKYLEDPAISFCAIGDVKSDEAPLQIAEFGQGKGLDQVLQNIYLEGGGGGNKHESYDFAANFYLNQVDLNNPEIPFFFVTGDEAFWDKETSKEIEKVFGHLMKISEIDSFEIWSALKKKYNVFHIKKAFYDPKIDVKINEQWVKALGEERVLPIKQPKACIDVMLGAIALTSGTRNLEQYINDMKTRGQTPERIQEVENALKCYAQKLENGTTNIVKNKVVFNNNLNIDPNESKNENNQNQISESQKYEIRTLMENSFNEELDEESKQMRNHLLNLKDKTIPKEFLCSLTGLVMIDPVMTCDGYVYERKAIEIWLKNNNTSPNNGKVLESDLLLPNFALKQFIKDFYESSK